MDFLELPREVNHHHTFYLSSCESGAGIGTHDSNISSRHSSLSSNASSNVDLPTPVPTNAFFHVLKRLHCLSIRRKKHGQYRSLSTALHLFFKKHHQRTSIDIRRASADFYKSPSSPQLPTDAQATTPMTKTNLSCQQLDFSNVRQDRISNSKTIDLLPKRRLRKSDKTVSEDNNTNTLSSVDLTFTPQMLPALCVTESTSSITPVQQESALEFKSVSHFFSRRQSVNLRFVTFLLLPPWLSVGKIISFYHINDDVSCFIFMFPFASASSVDLLFCLCGYDCYSSDIRWNTSELRNHDVLFALCFRRTREGRLNKWRNWNLHVSRAIKIMLFFPIDQTKRRIKNFLSFYLIYIFIKMWGKWRRACPMQFVIDMMTLRCQWLISWKSKEVYAWEVIRWQWFCLIYSLLKASGGGVRE